MKSTNSFFKLDSIWKKFGISSPDDLRALTKELTLRNEVPESVKKEFETIKDLIIHSYSNYRFLDSAYDKTLFTFEMALKKRYEEIEGSKCQKGLPKLITWAIKGNLFEEEEHQIRSLKDLRDKSAHPEEWKLLGNLSLYMIIRIKNIINGLYEDLELRRIRKLEYNQINKILKSFNDNGAILEINTQVFIVFLSQLVFYDNIHSPAFYYILFYPIFDLTITEDNRVDIPLPFVYRAIRYSRKLKEIKFIGFLKDEMLKLTLIGISQDKDRFSKWMNRFNEHEFPLMSEIQYRIAEIENFLWDKVFGNFKK